MNNTKQLTNNYKQLCVMRGTVLGNESYSSFEAFIRETTGARVKFEATLVSNVETPEHELRQDLCFYVHNEDIPKLAVKKHTIGVSWWEDVIANEGNIYCDTVMDAYGRDNWRLS